ncbi:pyridoxal phosphate-dependent transferase [Aspergillus cavernicola]|uniref:Pyridoxal phosphate-dependent transferase n=1 Tax=Aspergillus cavernicola TaxID=176166 RepID=A0ABR4I4U0_9EURO
MSALLQPPALGEPIPDREHAISVHFPAWDDVRDYGAGQPRVTNALQNGYPRSQLHKYNQALFAKCGQALISPSEELVLFPDYHVAKDCKSYISPRKIHSTNAANPEDVWLVLVKFNKAEDPPSAEDDILFVPRLYGVVHPTEFRKVRMSFWRLTGTGISSRLAESCLQRDFTIARISSSPLKASPPTEFPVYSSIRERVAELLNRAPINTGRAYHAKSDDVYLYPSGMAALYHIHHALPKWRDSDVIMLGFPYELSIKMIEIMGIPHRFLSAGTESDVDELEKILVEKSRIGQKIQSVWCECPNNPMLRTSNLERVRKLADQHDFIFVVDDTIGSFANVDVMDVADIIITSLSKWFSGHADVLAGSIFLNPNFPYYLELKKAFDAQYINNLYLADAMRLELNSRSYLKRYAQQNDTASAVVAFLYPYACNSNSTLANVYYPKVCWSRKNYQKVMRPATEDFTPGYGGFFSVDFDTVAAASAFFDTLPFYKGPSFGGDITIAIPYVQLVLQQEKTWALGHGLNETLVRISVGIEEKHTILECVKKALQAADATRKS